MSTPEPEQEQYLIAPLSQPDRDALQSCIYYARKFMEQRLSLGIDDSNSPIVIAEAWFKRLTGSANLILTGNITVEEFAKFKVEWEKCCQKVQLESVA